MLCTLFFHKCFYWNLSTYDGYYSAGKHASVIRERDFNSQAPLSDDEDEDRLSLKKRRIKRTSSSESDSFENSLRTTKYLEAAADAIARKAQSAAPKDRSRSAA